MSIIHPEKIDLSGNVTEKMIEDEIVKKPSILGLGDLVLIERQRTQPTNGRLDLLFQDPDTQRRYEVEIQLGDTDESHIIRTIEYWDTERKQYPQYDHCAVIVAENITSRFFNVISLFNGSIPLIAVKIEARKMGDNIILSLITVLEERSLGIDEKDKDIETTDRSYWINTKASKETVEMADKMIEYVNEFSTGFKPNYTKFYICPISSDERVKNFVWFVPRRNKMNVEIKLPFSEEIQDKIEEKGLNMGRGNRTYRLRLAPKDISLHKDFLSDLLKKAYENSK